MVAFYMLGKPQQGKQECLKQGFSKGGYDIKQAAVSKASAYGLYRFKKCSPVAVTSDGISNKWTRQSGIAGTNLRKHWLKTMEEHTDPCTFQHLYA